MSIAQELSRIAEFLWAVLTNWLVLVAGAIMAVLGVLERLRGRKVHIKVYRNILVCLLFIAVFITWRDAQVRLVQKGAAEAAPVKIDVSDVEGRKEIEALRKDLNAARQGVDAEARRELEATKAKLEKAEATIQALNPTQQPIAAFEVVADVLIRSAEQFNAHFVGSGGVAAFARATEPLLMTSSEDSFAESSGTSGTSRFRAVMNQPASGSLVRKPMAELRNAQYLQIELRQLPTDAAIIEGKATVTINGSQQIEFEIPPQIANGRRFAVRDMYPLRSKLDPK